MNIKEIKTLLKENKIHFYTYWDKKKLVVLANEHNLLLKIELEKEKSQDVKYNRLKTIKKNPRKVTLEDTETGEIKTFSSIYKAAKYRSGSQDGYLLGNRKGVWNNKYNVVIQ